MAREPHTPEINATEPTRVLLLGAAGMLGRAWVNLLQDEGIGFDSADVADGDLTDPTDVARLLTGAYSHVVNCAAWTDVDGAESHEPEAVRVNGDAVRLLAERARETGAAAVHFSTDYVFDGRPEGEPPRPYRTGKDRAPINAYGRSKAAGEEALEQAGGAFLCVRTSWLYAPWANNFVRTIARLAREREVLKVVDDQRGRPTSAEHLARNTLALIRAGATGMAHVTDGGECTWFGFANEIVRRTGAAAVVEPCGSTEFPRPARRPAYSVLDLSKTEALIGPIPDWTIHLADVIARLEPA